MAVTHSPGPWELSPGHEVDHAMVSAKGETIAVVRVRFDEGKANARLIAAAPDLLAALREWLAAGDESCSPETTDDVAAMIRYAQAVTAAKAAVAKAEGA